MVYVVQPAPRGLCDAIFRATPLIAADEQVVIGLPDTVWSPEDAIRQLPDNQLSLLLFPVEHPEFFDAVVTDECGRVRAIQVKQKDAASRWIWGVIKMPGFTFHALHELWCRPERRDEYFGTLINQWLAEGGEALGVAAGTEYVDVGTLHGYRRAIQLLDGKLSTKRQVRLLEDEARTEEAKDEHIRAVG